MGATAPLRWSYLDADGRRIGASEDFADRALAEEWLGDRWRDLLADGILGVELVSGDDVLYRMGLTPGDAGADT